VKDYEGILNYLGNKPGEAGYDIMEDRDKQVLLKKMCPACKRKKIGMTALYQWCKDCGLQFLFGKNDELIFFKYGKPEPIDGQ